jgi:hypothetical protein
MQEATGTISAVLESVERIAIKVLRVIPKTRFKLERLLESYDTSTLNKATRVDKLNIAAANSHCQSQTLNLVGLLNGLDRCFVQCGFCIGVLERYCAAISGSLEIGKLSC